jgi:hypothetical protein
MLSLVDVLPKHERVDIGTCDECNGTGGTGDNGQQIKCEVCQGSGRKRVDVFGISGEDIGRILVRYPTAFTQMVASAGKPVALEPGLMGAMLAASQRKPDDPDTSLLGDEKIEKRGRSFGVGAQMKILKAMGRCTFPDGIGPFLEDLVLTSSSAKEAMEVIVRIASKERSMTSPPPPKPSEPPATQASGN